MTRDELRALAIDAEAAWVDTWTKGRPSAATPAAREAADAAWARFHAAPVERAGRTRIDVVPDRLPDGSYDTRRT